MKNFHSCVGKCIGVLLFRWFLRWRNFQDWADAIGWATILPEARGRSGTQRLGSTDITVNYCRPLVGVGREIWAGGGLVACRLGDRKRMRTHDFVYVRRFRRGWGQCTAAGTYG